MSEFDFDASLAALLDDADSAEETIRSRMADDTVFTVVLTGPNGESLRVPDQNGQTSMASLREIIQQESGTPIDKIALVDVDNPDGSLVQNGKMPSESGGEVEIQYWVPPVDKWGEFEAVESTFNVAAGNQWTAQHGRPEWKVASWVYRNQRQGGQFFNHLAQKAADMGVPTSYWGGMSENMRLQIEAQIPRGAGVGNCDHFALMTAAQLVSEPPPESGAKQYVYRVYMYPGRWDVEADESLKIPGIGHFGHALCVTSTQKANVGDKISSLNTKLATIVDGWHDDAVKDANRFLAGQNCYHKPCDLKIIYRYECDGTALSEEQSDKLQAIVKAEVDKLRDATDTREDDPDVSIFPRLRNGKVNDYRTDPERVAKLGEVAAHDDEAFETEVIELTPNLTLLDDTLFMKFYELNDRTRAYVLADPERIKQLFHVLGQESGQSFEKHVLAMDSEQLLMYFRSTDAVREALTRNKKTSKRLRRALRNADTFATDCAMLTDDQLLALCEASMRKFRKAVLANATTRAQLEEAIEDSDDPDQYASWLD